LRDLSSLAFFRFLPGHSERRRGRHNRQVAALTCSLRCLGSWAARRRRGAPSLPSPDRADRGSWRARRLAAAAVPSRDGLRLLQRVRQRGGPGAPLPGTARVRLSRRAPRAASSQRPPCAAAASSRRPPSETPRATGRRSCRPQLHHAGPVRQHLPVPHHQAALLRPPYHSVRAQPAPFVVRVGERLTPAAAAVRGAGRPSGAGSWGSPCASRTRSTAGMH
jgi:hypothetical protein